MRVLFVDDDEDFRIAMVRGLEQHGVAVALATSLTEAKTAVETESFDALLVDVCLGPSPHDRSGLELVRHARHANAAPSVVLTGRSSMAEEALAAGAVRCLFKGVDFRVDHVLGALAEAAANPAARLTPSSLGMVGESGAMEELRAAIRLVAPTEDIVLITGERGTGKELVAAAVHKLSRRRGPFCAVNVCSLSPTLFESALFGHTRGAFTGAHAAAPGLLRQAAHGTLFLDEIGHLPSPAQASLLRVLQTRRYLPVGGSEEVDVTARLICATNAPLRELVARGAFRADLFDRLDVLRLRVPPLRARGADVQLIAQHFAERKGKALTPAALALIASSNFPGNVRELENVVRRATVFSTGHEVDAAALARSDPERFAARARPLGIRQRQREERRQAALRAYYEAGQNFTRAGAMLGLERRVVARLVKEATADDAPGSHRSPQEEA